jgi:predicted nucleotidyltransferase
MRLTMIEQITISQEKIAEFCRRHHVRRLSLFGSALRDDFGPDSDIDLLVEFEPGAAVSLFDLGGMQVELSELFARHVDLKTPGFLSRYFRQDVLEQAQVIYERS